MKIVTSSRNGSLLGSKKFPDLEETKIQIHFTISGNELLTKEEVAKILRVTIRTIANYRLSGLLPFIKINEHFYLYPKAGLEALLEKSFCLEEISNSRTLINRFNQTGNHN